MKLTPEEKNQLDAMTLGQLMARFRFFPHANFTQGEVGQYLQKILKEKKEKHDGTAAAGRKP